MIRNLKRILGICIILLFLPAFLFGLTGEEIIKKMEANQVHKSARTTGTMEITDRFGTRVKTFKVFALGEEKTLLEFTNPEEAGQKILRIDDEIYLYFPEAEEIIHLQGAALKDGVMGSDFSYEDLTGGRDLLDSYTVELEGSEPVNGADCYRLRLKARDVKSRDVVYPLQVVWVDKELFVYRRVIQYSLKGKALKEMNIKDFRQIAGKNVPVYFEMMDKMKKNSRTVFKTDEIEIDISLDPAFFSLEELSW